MRKLRVLVACEESQVVCKQMRAVGHECFSVDLQPCSGGKPEWHIQADCFEVMQDDWDMMIAHPVCKYLANSGVQWLYNKDGTRNEQRWDDLAKGREFFMRFMGNEVAHIPKRVVENPIPHCHGNLPPYTQLFQPWMFGSLFSKATCLWIEGLNPLVPEILKKPPGVKNAVHEEPPGPDREKNRSKTYPGPARAMAIQWTTDWIPDLNLTGR